VLAAGSNAANASTAARPNLRIEPKTITSPPVLANSFAGLGKWAPHAAAQLLHRAGTAYCGPDFPAAMFTAFSPTMVNPVFTKHPETQFRPIGRRHARP